MNEDKQSWGEDDDDDDPGGGGGWLLPGLMRMDENGDVADDPNTRAKVNGEWLKIQFPFISSETRKWKVAHPWLGFL